MDITDCFCNIINKCFGYTKASISSHPTIPSGEGAGSYICQIIRKIPTEVIEMVDNEKDWSVAQIQLIYKIQREMEKNRQLLLYSQIITCTHL